MKIFVSRTCREKNILIIDDNAALANSLMESLIRWGATVQTAKSKSTSTQIIQKMKPPEKFDFNFRGYPYARGAEGGLDMVEILKEGARHTRSIVIMLPINHRHGDSRIERCRHPNCLIKPIKPSPLIDVIESVSSTNTAPEAGAPRRPAKISSQCVYWSSDDSEDNAI